jgi:asparagine synthase (glutamine-hydrolysing)
MPAAIAGVAGWLEAESRSVGVALPAAMAVPDLGIAAQTPQLLAQGDARIAQVGDHQWNQHDGWPDEEVIVELDPERVVLRRDALGVRPLYYACSPDRTRLAWASRPTQLAAVPWVDRRPHWDTLLDVLAVAPRSDPTRTCLEGIRQVRPGHFLEWRPGRTIEIQHWDPSDYLWDGGRGPRDAFAGFASLVGDVLQKRITEPSALLLSGGIDSPTLAAAAMRRHLPVVGLSNIYPRFPATDESVNICAVLNALGMTGELLTPMETASQFDVDAELNLTGEPNLATGQAVYIHMLRAAAERGYRLVIDGHNGDSALGPLDGVGRFLPARPVLAVQTWRVHRARGDAPRALARRWLHDLSPTAFDLLKGGKAMLWPSGPHFETRPLMALWGRQLLDRQRAEGRLSWQETQLMAASPWTSELMVVLGRMADSFGIDIVHPFADRPLIEFLLSLPPEVKHAGGRAKGLARMAFPELPAAVRLGANKVFADGVFEALHPLSEMRHLLQDPTVAVPFVNYERLRERLASAQPYEVGELHHLRVLVLAHRFLETRCQPAEYRCSG